jgi:hypothetical protein
MVYRWLGNVVEQRRGKRRVAPKFGLLFDKFSWRIGRQYVTSTELQGYGCDLQAMLQQSTWAGMVMGLRGRKLLHVIRKGLDG